MRWPKSRLLFYLVFLCLCSMQHQYYHVTFSIDQYGDETIYQTPVCDGITLFIHCLRCFAILWASSILKLNIFTRFVARALIFFNQTHYRALIQARALVIFQVKLCTKIIFEDKYFTTLILFPCQFIHIERKLFIFIYSRLKSNYSASCSLHQSHHPHQHQARFLL